MSRGTRQDWVVLTDHGAGLEHVGELGVIGDLPCVRRDGQGALDHLNPDYDARRLLVQLD